MDVSLIVVGDELLDGHVPDRNGPWLVRELSRESVVIRGMHVVRDDMDDLVDVLRREVAARVGLIVVVGGLGVTDDDITYAAMAQAVGRPLELCSRLARWVERWGRGLSDGQRKAMLRMAHVPQGARLLEQDGGVPVVALEVPCCDGAPGSTVVALPGVPDHMREQYRSVVAPLLLFSQRLDRVSVDVEHTLPEPVIADCLPTLSRLFPAVKVGSYVGSPMVMRMTGPREQVRAAAVRARMLLDARRVSRSIDQESVDRSRWNASIDMI